MSQSNFAMTDRSTQWNHTQKNFYTQHLTNPDNCGVDLNPVVQRVDSYGTSASSHEPHSTFSIESPLDFNQPTPSDHTNTDFLVPELGSPFWQDNLVEDGEINLNGFGTTYQNMEPAEDSFPPSIGLASHKIPLPSPQLTNSSTPEVMNHSKQPSQSSSYMPTPTSEPSQGARPLAIETIDPEHLHTPVRTNSYVTSPIIHVSSHPRGDSPARSDFEQRRPNKKRSASNLSQGGLLSDSQGSPQRDMLNVPQHGHSLVHEEGEDNVRQGRSPTQRGVEEHPSLVDMQQTEDAQRTVAEVSDWLQYISLNPNPRYAKGALLQDRVRSRSTGARPRIGQRPILKVIERPGPGLVIEERSDYWYSSDEESNLDLQPEDHPTHPKVHVPEDDEENIPADADVVPLSSEHYRPGPWRDPVPVQPPNDGRRYQPATSNLAMAKFNARNREFDTLSRSATWGTSTTSLRRLSDGDQDSVLEVGRTRHLSLSKARSAFVGKVKTTIKRSGSRGKKSIAEHDFTSELRKVQSPDIIDDSSSADSQPRPTRPPISRAKSPSISAALGSATGSLAAVGAGPATLNINTSPQHHPESKIRNFLGRVRRKSDVNKSPRSPIHLQTMLSQGGGLPGPSIIPSAPETLESITYTHTPISTVPSQVPTPSPITMVLSPKPANVVPNMEGFKVQIRELNLMLDDFLLTRTAYDQVRRYKRLVKNKVEHVQACTEGRCLSGSLCSALGSAVEVLPHRPRGNSNIVTQFKTADSDDDEVFDGFVTANAFPEGIPLPPASKLPARFECPLCFQVKTFQKPSDWTKHVHEDVQPFTCTFQDCQDSKPFKRKADWVRHENERHRHLEWWHCNINECTHRCYRKDNFVQHLVREHKMKEPKPNRRANSNVKGKGKYSANMDLGDQQFWQLVDDCRHESTLDPRREPCPFCGNTCTSWKKLSVHVGKHMEQIAMPILDLVSKRNVTKDTPISPLEPLPSNSQGYNFNDMSLDLNTHLSPFSPGNTSYPNSSATQSPFLTYHRVLNSPNMVMSPAADTSYHSHMAQRSLDQSYMYHNPVSGMIYDGYTGTAQVTSFPTYGGQTVFQTLTPFTGSEHLSHTISSHDGFGRLFDTTASSQFLSSPEQQFSSVHMAHGMLPGQNLQNVTSHPMSNSPYMPPQQDQWHQ